MIGFCFPKLNCKRCVIKVKVWYDPTLHSFESFHEKVNVADIKNEILNPVSFNRKLLEQCAVSKYKVEAKDYTITYGQEELKSYGDHAVQMKCKYGVLIEATVNGELCCIKQPCINTAGIN